MRVGFGFTNFINERIRILLYVGRPNWDLLRNHRRWSPPGASSVRLRSSGILLRWELRRVGAAGRLAR